MSKKKLKYILWEKPKIKILKMEETKGGNYDADSEGSLWFLSGSS